MELTHDEVRRELNSLMNVGNFENALASMNGLLRHDEAMRARLAACEADRDEARANQAHWCAANIELGRKLEQAEARVQALEARLEIDHAFDQDMQRIEIPVEQRDKFPDGIACRDATIQLQDERVKALEQENARLREALELVVKVGNNVIKAKFNHCGTMNATQLGNRDCVLNMLQQVQHALEGE